MTELPSGSQDPGPSLRPRPPAPRLTVIVPARDEESMIGECLRSIREQAQALPAATVETIVVDDASRDGTAAVVARDFPEVRLVRFRPRRRLGRVAAARNHAVALARSRVVAFLDADCAPCPGWIEAILARGEERTVRMGRVVLEPSYLSRVLGILEFGEFIGVKPRRLANYATLNAAGPTDLFRAIPFPNQRFGSDRLHAARLAHEKVPILFEPGQAVVHRFRPGLGNAVRRERAYALRTLAVRAVDPTLPGGRIAALGPIAAPALSAMRLYRDLGRLRALRAAAGITLLATIGLAGGLVAFRVLFVALLAAFALDPRPARGPSRRRRSDRALRGFPASPAPAADAYPVAGDLPPGAAVAASVAS